MKITLIGLGFLEGDITLNQIEALDKATKIYARSEHMCGFHSLDGYEVEPLDSIFLKSRSFDTLNKNLAKTILKASKISDVCYCVDGSVLDDEACKIIIEKSKDVKILGGHSKGDAIRTIAKLKSTTISYTSAYDLENLKPCDACVIFDIDDCYSAQNVKEKLSELFGEESKCVFVQGENTQEIFVYELDRMENYNCHTGVAIENLDFFSKQKYDFCDLEKIVKLLRGENGCPWDRAQTNESITKNMVEEAYELIDAVQNDDDDALKEEAGDVLLQSVFHAVMKEEIGSFNNSEMLTDLVKKLIYRHSHIFGKDKASGENEALGVWEKNKGKEKHYENYGETLVAVPKTLPSAMRAQKIQKRAAKSGMDFLSAVSASENLADEVAEMLNALIEGDTKQVESECGDLLFSAINTVRLAGVNAEDVLTYACDKFVERFVECEKLIVADKKNINDLDELVLNWYWQKAKNATKKH